MPVFGKHQNRAVRQRNDGWNAENVPAGEGLTYGDLSGSGHGDAPGRAFRAVVRHQVLSHRRALNLLAATGKNLASEKQNCR